MNQYGREVMRYWRLWRPASFDSLADPRAYFEEVGERHEALVESTTQERLRRVENQSLETQRFHAAEDVEYLLPYGGGPRTEPDWLQEEHAGTEYQLDPRIIDEDGLPRESSHPLWQSLEDPDVPAHEFHAAWATWAATVTRLALVETAGDITAPDPHDPDGWEIPDLMGFGKLKSDYFLGESWEVLRADNESQVLRTPEMITTRGGFGTALLAPSRCSVRLLTMVALGRLRGFSFGSRTL